MAALFSLPQHPRSPWVVLMGCTAALLSLGATNAPPPSSLPASSVEALQAGIVIQIPVIIPGYPVIILPQPQVEERVTVEFVAEGDDWATVYLDDRILFRALNTRRRYTVELEPGAYRLRITGTTQFDEWGSGYLDVGRADANLVVVRYSKTDGVSVSGDPYAWIPD